MHLFIYHFKSNVLLLQIAGKGRHNMSVMFTEYYIIMTRCGLKSIMLKWTLAILHCFIS